ncbi:MAG: YitT family protein [Sphaerochaetaceae bacterium]|jgi:uncharacterized membrane-anchored protein YitT (DUF2179 family)|nr:YitT family protein [Sphaerochaetaceae bacterium]NLO61774.1 YitT family protein [Spirochaetales bacterium]MDD2405882.1 YitT family protein [Sphaerochaetaceae bacterium]MDD3671416.1 YitT family protein [Sphaerochaetaceae bacterium]MDD4258250.1 YitT family protein [Sphaerochaetaceae bacterium]
MKINRRTITDYVMIIIGSLIAGFGIAAFTTPAKIAGGGVNGMATIFYHTLGFEPGIAMLCMNIPIFIAGMKVFGPKYGFKSVVGMLLFSLSVSLFGLIIGYEGIIPYTDSVDVLLSALFGGIFIGAGIGFVMKGGANTGGTDIIAQIISRYTPLPLGTSLLFADGLVIVTSAFIFGIERAMYAIITVYTSTQMINYVIMVAGTKYAKTVYIFSEKLDIIKQLIINDLHHGGTMFTGTGIYTGQDREMLMAVIPNQQISQLTSMVHHTDPKAFMIVEEAYQVLGEGFTPMQKVVPASIDSQGPRRTTFAAKQMAPIPKPKSKREH